MQADFQFTCSPPLAQLRIVGDLDLTTQDRLCEVLEFLRSRGCTRIEIDLDAVTFTQACVLGVLHEEQRQLLRQGGSLAIVAASPYHQLAARLAGHTGLLAPEPLSQDGHAPLLTMLRNGRRIGAAGPSDPHAGDPAARYPRAMSPSVNLTERMSQAARELQNEPDPQATMEAAVRLATTNVRGCDAVAISIARRRGEIETPAYSDELALSGDLLQYTLREGPCLDAAWHERVVHSPDLAEDSRWPVWGPRVVAQHDVHSMLCVQLFTHGDVLGAMNLYSRQRGAFDEQDRDDGLALAAHVAVAIAAAQTEDQLTRALDTRTLISQAVGIVMERYRLDPAAAFRVLARVSSEANIKLSEIARELIETGHLHGTPEHAPEDGAPSR